MNYPPPHIRGYPCELFLIIRGYPCELFLIIRGFNCELSLPHIRGFPCELSLPHIRGYPCELFLTIRGFRCELFPPLQSRQSQSASISIQDVWQWKRLTATLSLLIDRLAECLYILKQVRINNPKNINEYKLYVNCMYIII